MALENRSNSALFKRAEQLKRWEESETNREAPVPNKSSRKIQFPSGCIFLAACAAGDKEEIQRLLQKGTDINTANVDGLTALHQACIDDNLEMVEFLVKHGADVNRGDNEGWTPLHATASCGFVSIARFLVENGANVAAVNNDAELPLDIADSDEMEDMLQQDINAKGIDCEEARNEEERMMLRDAKEWLNSGDMEDAPHPKTGATALHVAAAKGYIKVMSVLVQGGADVNIQDLDGWTPLHAAAHWGQKEACEILVENFCDMETKNCVGQTSFDVADTEMLRLLEELKKKQATLQKDPGDSNAIMQKSGAVGQKRRMSVTDKSNLINKDASSERQVLDRSISEEESSNKVKKVEVEIKAEPAREDPAVGEEQESSDSSESTDDSETSSDSNSLNNGVNSEEEKKNRVNKVEPARIPITTAPEVKTVPNQAPTSPPKTPTENDDGSVPSWRRSGSFRNRDTPSKNLTLRIGEKDNQTHKATTPTSPANRNSSDTPEVVLRRTQSFEADEKRGIREEAKTAVGQPTTTATTTTTTVATTTVSLKTTASPTSPLPASQVRSPAKGSVSPSPATPTTPTTPGGSKLSPGNILKNLFKSFVPPVRDEESETQRKAHAKRVRETRRSTQGVTLEEIKSAEQLVKKKNQQQLDKATQQLNNNDQSPVIIPTTTTNSTSISATITTGSPTVPSGTKDDEGIPSQERRPSWRLRVDNLDRSKFLLEDARNRSSDSPTTYIRRPSGASMTRPSSAPVEGIGSDTSVTLALRRQSKPSDDKEQDKENDVRNAQATQGVIQRRRRPKRRSTGVVHVDMDEIDPDRQESPGRGESEDIKLNNEESGNDVSSGHSSRLGSSAGDSPAHSRAITPANSAKDGSENGELDYKKLYETAMGENERLREKLKKTEDCLSDAKSHVEKVSTTSGGKTSMSEMEKRERRAMERKLSEMEEELKQLQKLKAENERLKAENRALTRVVSKLTNSANATK